MLTRYRRLTHERLSRLELRGRVLDFGGSKRSAYWRFIKGKPEITAVNIDPKALPEAVWDLEKFPYPFKDHSYDAVIAINLLEHLWHWKELLGEASRILVPGGTLVVIVPFLHAVHGSPRDFFRFTREALARAFEEAGFEVEVEEMGAGVFSARAALLQRLLPSFLAYPIEIAARVADSLFVGISTLLRRKYHKKDYPLGYIAVGRRV